MEIDTAKPNNPTPPSENVAGFQLTLLFSNSRKLQSLRNNNVKCEFTKS